MVRIVLPFALVSAASASAAADKDVFAVQAFTSTDAGCGAPSPAPDAVHAKVGSCLLGATGKYMQLPAACPGTAGGDAVVKQFTDAACTQADTADKVTVKDKTCTTVAGIDVKLSGCATMSCTGADDKALTCEAKGTTTTKAAASNNSTQTDNAMTVGVAGAFLLSASALIIA